MTIDDRIERLEFLNSSYIEQRRKDREDYLILERDLRSHIEAIWRRQERRDEELDKRWRETQDMLRDTGRETDERIRTLVSAIGEFIKKAS